MNPSPRKARDWRNSFRIKWARPLTRPSSLNPPVRYYRCRDKVNNKHITLVQKSVAKKLETYESETNDKKIRELETIQDFRPRPSRRRPIRKWKPRRIGERNTTPAPSNNSSRVMNCWSSAPLRSSARSATVKLKQRWGQVSAADTGAEAFFAYLNAPISL